MAWYSSDSPDSEPNHVQVNNYPDSIQAETPPPPKNIEQISERIEESARLFNFKSLTFWSGAALLVLALSVKAGEAFLIIFAFWVPIHIITRRWDKERRFIKISYDTGSLPEHYRSLMRSFGFLEENHKLWTLDRSESIFGFHEQKRHAGASSLIDMSRCNVGKPPPPWIRSNINFPSLHTKQGSFYFLPEGILLFNGLKIEPLNYSDVKPSYSFESVIDENPPEDATITGKTWKHPNKDGSPDRRFSVNYQIPICLYGKVIFKFGPDIKIEVVTSKKQSGKDFYESYLKS